MDIFLALVAGSTQLGMGLLGWYVSGREHKRLGYLFIVLGLFGLAAVGLTSYRSTVSQAETQRDIQAAKQSAERIEQSTSRTEKTSNELKGELQKVLERPASPIERLEDVSKIVGGGALSPGVSYNFSRQIDVKGGLPLQLSSVLANAGYAGPMSLQELTVCNKSTNGSPVYRGDSPKVDSTSGVGMDQEDCYTERASAKQRDYIDATQIYFFTPKDGRVSVIARAMR